MDEDADYPMSRHRLVDLRPHSFYELQVIAVNDLGRSDVTSQFIFSTAAKAGKLVCARSQQLFFLYLVFKVK